MRCVNKNTLILNLNDSKKISDELFFKKVQKISNKIFDLMSKDNICIVRQIDVNNIPA